MKDLAVVLEFLGGAPNAGTTKRGRGRDSKRCGKGGGRETHDVAPKAKEHWQPPEAGKDREPILLRSLPTQQISLISAQGY